MSASRQPPIGETDAATTASHTYIPPARPQVRDTLLQRPDWTKPGSRDPRLLWLDRNENTDPAMMAAVSRALEEMDPGVVVNYPDASPLYHALSRHLGVDAHSLVLAPGSDGVIGSVFRAFVSPKDVVLHTNPTYAMYPIYARIHGAAAVTLDYEAHKDGPRLAADVVLDAIRRTRPKLVCLPNPDSPTGTVFQPRELKAIVEAALSAGAVILIDEAYHPFYPDSAISWINEYPNVIVGRTFSKAWALAGARLGYGVATPETTLLLHKVRPNYEVNMVAVALAVRMITDFEDEMVASVRRLNEGRDYFVSAMQQLGLRTLASRASFCHVAFGARADAVHDALSSLVLYRKESGTGCLAGFSRFSSTTIERFEPVVDRIRNAL